MIGSAIITHFDLGKKSHQKERSAKKKRMYSLMRWKPQSVKSRKHMSHFTVADPNQMPASQEIPGYYLLCPQQYFTNQNFRMHAHYQCLHWKRMISVLDMNLLFCKCSEVPNHGCNNSIRNGHYHCPICHKPCNQIKAVAVHLVSRHKVSPNAVKHL